MTQPWMKFYPADWRSDPKLRLCSLAARGLWMEMLALMHEAEPYGHLTVGGRAMTPRELANLVGIATKSCSKLLDELEINGVFSRDETGIIFSRRMVRDAEKAQKHRENGAKGGNPKLIQGVNPEDKAQKPEARSQKPDNTPPVVPPEGDKPKSVQRRVRLPQDWRARTTPPPEQARTAADRGWSSADAARQWQHFVDHHLARASTMADWPAAWRTWLTKAQQFEGAPKQDAKRERTMEEIRRARGQQSWI